MSKHQYPFTIESVELDAEKDHQWQPSEKLLRFTREELANLTTVYDRLALDAGDTDRFCAFASGGMVLLIHAVARYCERHFGSQSPPNEEVERLQSLFYLLPSVTWLTRESEDDSEVNQKSTLCRWLCENGHVKRIDFCDTTFSGGGINSIKKTIIKYASSTSDPLPAIVNIRGVLDMSRFKGTEIPNAEQVLLRDGETTLTSELIPVERLISEDEISLIGYERISMTVEMSSKWRNRNVIVDNSDNTSYTLMGNPVAALFSDLLLNFDKVVSKTSPKSGHFDEELFKKIRRDFVKSGLLRKP